MRSLGPVLALAAVFLFAGCGSKPRPPVFSLHDFQRLVVVPFENGSVDDGLPPDLEDQMAALVANLRAVPVIQASQAAAHLKTLGASAADVALDDALRGKLAKKFNADLIMAGSADAYEETLKDGEPTRKVLDPETGKAEWGYMSYRRVEVRVTARLLDPATGSLLWSGNARGYSYDNKWNVLPIPGHIKLPPVEGLENLIRLVKRKARELDEDDGRRPGARPDRVRLLYKRSAFFADLREKAVFQAVNYMVNDFRGRGGWYPGIENEIKK
jgi:hypothetical protein